MESSEVAPIVVDNGLGTHNIPVPEGLKDWGMLAEFADSIAARNTGKFIYDSFLTGDAFLVTREVINKIGTFDPFFFGYFADHDYGVRARIAGFDLVLAQGAYAYHKRAANFDYLPADLRQEKIASRWAKVHENWARFKVKYGLPVEQSGSSMDHLEWERLSSTEFARAKHYVPPQDYARFLV